MLVSACRLRLARSALKFDVPGNSSGGGRKEVLGTSSA